MMTEMTAFVLDPCQMPLFAARAGR